MATPPGARVSVAASATQRGGAAAPPLDVDDALDRTFGNGTYQLQMFLIVGLCLYSLLFPYQVMAVYTNVKMVADPMLAGFTKDSVAFASSAFFFGWLLGAVLVGPAADRFGRRNVVFGGASGLAICGAIATAVPSAAAGSYFAFVAAKFATGTFAAYGSMASVYLQESIPGSLRGRSMIALNTTYSLMAAAQAALCGSVTFPMDWRLETAIWYAPVVLGVLVGLPLLGESPMFLSASGRMAEADSMVTRIARTNGDESSACGIVLKKPEVEQTGRQSDPKVSLLSPELLPRVAALAVCWIACSLTNYGLCFSAGALSDDLYTNSTLLNLVDLLGYTIVFGVDTIGRRATQAGCFFVAALCLLLCGALTPGTWPVVACALLGRLFVNACFTVLYIYVVELFPTSCRSSALGICTVAARIGGLFAPFAGGLPAAVSCPIFGALCLVSAFLSMRLPETAGRKLD